MARSARPILFVLLIASVTVWALVALAAVSVGGVTVKGALSQADVTKVLGGRTGAIDGCAVARARAGVGIAGQLTLVLTIRADGALASAKPDPGRSTVKDAAFAGCVVGQLTSLTFPAAKGDTSVVYVVNVRADADKDSSKTDVAAQALAETKAPAPPPAEPAPVATSAPKAKSIASAGEVSRGGGHRSASSGPAATTASPPPPPRPAKERRVASEKPSRMPMEEVADEGAASGYSAPAAPAMQAGRHDDNKQYNRFLEFLRTNKSLIPCKLDVDERLVLRTLDKNGRSLHNCKVEVAAAQGKPLATTTYADGSTQFFPSDAAPKGVNDFAVSATCGGVTTKGQLSRDGKRTVDLTFDFARALPANVPVDVAIVLDTTGSMGGQIERLKQTLQAIHLQLSELSAKPDLRFALVAYRDHGDDYVTQVTPFTKDVKAFQKALNKLSADGGGDTPEDLQEALRQAMKTLDWRSSAVRLGFVIADAVPHTDYGQEYTYVSAMRESLARGIKWSMVGAGGLPLNGEVIFRQIAQYTMGEYVFVTQGEVQHDSGGHAGEASHHVGTNYSVENLDQAIVRIVRRELSYLTDTPRDFDDTIVAEGTKATPRDKVLAPAVQEVLRQLTDYSAIRLEAKTPVAVVPVDNADKAYQPVAEYLSEQMVLSASRKGEFKVVERDLRAVAQEQKMQLSDLFEVKETVQFGKLIGAELLIVSRLTVRGEVGELYAKLIRVETGEILSAAKVEFKGGVLLGS